MMRETLLNCIALHSWIVPIGFLGKGLQTNTESRENSPWTEKKKHRIQAKKSRHTPGTQISSSQSCWLQIKVPRNIRDRYDGCSNHEVRG